MGRPGQRLQLLLGKNQRQQWSFSLLAVLALEYKYPKIGKAFSSRNERYKKNAEYFIIACFLQGCKWSKGWNWNVEGADEIC